MEDTIACYSTSELQMRGHGSMTSDTVDHVVISVDYVPSLLCLLYLVFIDLAMN